MKKTSAVEDGMSGTEKKKESWWSGGKEGGLRGTASCVQMEKQTKKKHKLESKMCQMYKGKKV